MKNQQHRCSCCTIPVGGRSHGFGGPDSLLFTAPARSQGLGGGLGQHPGAPVAKRVLLGTQTGTRQPGTAGSANVPDMGAPRCSRRHTGAPHVDDGLVVSLLLLSAAARVEHVAYN